MDDNQLADANNPILLEKKHITEKSKDEKLKLYANDAYRYGKTIALFTSWCCLGLNSEVYGPTLPSIMFGANLNFQHSGFVLLIRAFGLLIGSIIGGISSDLWKYHRVWLLSASLAIFAIVTASLPTCLSLATVTANLFVSGIAHGMLTTAGNPLLAVLWEEKAAGPFNFMHAGYGVGANVAPLIFAPFTFNLTSEESLAKYDRLFRYNSSSGQERSMIIRLQAPCLIIASVSVLIAVVFVLFGSFPSPIDEYEVSLCSTISSLCAERRRYVLEKRPSYGRRLMHNIRRLKDEVLSFRYGVICVALFFAYVMLIGNERIFDRFFFSYLTLGSLKFTNHEGYRFGSIYWLCFSGSRFLIFFLALRISIKILYICQLSFAFVSSLLLAILPTDWITFYVCGIIFGLSKGPIFPTTLGVANLFIVISGFTVIIVNIASGIGAMTFQYLIGYSLHTYGQWTFPVVVASTALAMLVCGIILLLIGHCFGSRHASSDNQSKIN